MKNFNNNVDYFQQVFDTLYEKIVVFLYYYCRNRASAENVAQETFITFWENIHKIDKNKSPLPYLYFIAKNKALNEIKRDIISNKYTTYVKRRETEITYKALSSITMDQVQMDELSSAIGKCLSKMNPNTAETFKLSRFKGLKNAEIAKEQNISIKTVEYRLMCALRILKTNLKEFLIFLFS
jgi:RNA polymerase sigma factor, sigma-70 family/RNA polymerase sigma-70 factor, Bacteroides expansion family 1